MREIKFRQWCSRDKKFHYWGFLQGGSEFFESPLGYMSKDNPRESQQFTGLKDKNGKEIYEGDILDNKPQMIKICWDSIGGKWFGHYVDKKRTSSFWMGEEFKNYEVIGNIYENPDLLKESES